MTTRILTICGSLRHGSLNRRLVGYITSLLNKSVDVTAVDADLAQYSLPLYDANHEERSGIPRQALQLHELLRNSDGVFIASPEYNASVSPLLSNMLAWVSRVPSDGGIKAAFGKPVFALGSASPGGFGGYRGLMALRQSLELQLGATVLPSMTSISHAHTAFSEDGKLLDERSQQITSQLVHQLLSAAGKHS